MEKDPSLNILVIDDEENARLEIKVQLFSALSKNFNKPFEYIKNSKDLIFQYAKSLKEVLNIFEKQKNFDLITLDGHIGTDGTESSIDVIEYLKKDHPKLLDKIVIISGDMRFLKNLEKEQQIKGFLKGFVDPKEEERFNEQINKITKSD